MTDRPKPKSLSAKTTNDTRPNRKAGKKHQARGAQPVRLSEQEKVLLGGGIHVTFNGVGSDPSTQSNGKRA